MKQTRQAVRDFKQSIFLIYLCLSTFVSHNSSWPSQVADENVQQNHKSVATKTWPM